MTDFTLYLSPKKPTTVKAEGSIVADAGDTDIYLAPLAYAGGLPEKISLGLLPPGEFSEDDTMFEAFFDAAGISVSWERRKASYDSEILLSGITISFAHPVGDIEAYPYWFRTIIEAWNPDKISPHYPFIVQRFPVPADTRGPIESETPWVYSLSGDDSHDETQPIVRPGEYISCRQELAIDGKVFSRSIRVKYETPLFTGGWIVSKTGEGTEPRYTVEVFGVTVSGIMPTDFYSKYSVGKWVYLMKDVSLSPGKQSYGSGSIGGVGSGSSYRLAPFNFQGPMYYDCAVDSGDAIDISSSYDFEEVFDMIQYEGVLTNVDHGTETGTVEIPGEGEQTLPIFYYCSGSDTIVGGSRAFNIGDNVLVCKKDNTWTDAKIIGFPGEIKECKKTYAYVLLKHDSEEEGASDRYWYVVWDALNNTLADIEWEHEGTEYQFNTWPINDQIIETWWDEKKAEYPGFTTTLEGSAWDYRLYEEYNRWDYDYHIIGWMNGDGSPVGDDILKIIKYPSDISDLPDEGEWRVREGRWNYGVRSGYMLGDKGYDGRHHHELWYCKNGITSKCYVHETTWTPYYTLAASPWSINPQAVMRKAPAPHFVSYVLLAMTENVKHWDWGTNAYLNNDWNIKVHISPLHGFNLEPDILPVNVSENTQLSELFADRAIKKGVNDNNINNFYYKEEAWASSYIGELSIDSVSFMNDEPLEDEGL